MAVAAVPAADLLSPGDAIAAAPALRGGARALVAGADVLPVDAFVSAVMRNIAGANALTYQQLTEAYSAVAYQGVMRGQGNRAV